MMIKVSISTCSYHAGYHYQLINYPPKSVHYYLESVDKMIPTEAVFNEPNNKWERFLEFGQFRETYDYIPYFNNSKQLIHSHAWPVVDKTPYVIDLDMFFYPFLNDCYEFERIRGLKVMWPLANKLSSKMKARLDRAKELLKSRFCKKILPWSRWCRDYIIDFIDDPEIVKKIELLYPAVHNIAAYKRKHKGNIRLIFICSDFFARKGGDDVLRAFDILRHDYKDIELICVGEIPENIYHKYRNYKNIKFYTSLPKEKLFEAYRQSDIFVLPTRYDTFGISVLEAMNFCLPIITTKGKTVPVSQEIVNDGVSGFLVERKYGNDPKNVTGNIDFNDFVNKLRLLIEDEKLRERMGKASKSQIVSGKFSIKKRNEKLEKIYAEALQ
jgi:glycosyltransferase involved in cell wall biosynthesis